MQDTTGSTGTQTASWSPSQTDLFPYYTPITQYTWSCQTITAQVTLQTGPGHYLGECNALLQQQYARGATDI